MSINRETTRQEALESLNEVLSILAVDPARRSLFEQLFILNNYFYPHLNEGNFGCGSCVDRVLTRMNQFWNETGVQELNNIING